MFRKKILSIMAIGFILISLGAAESGLQYELVKVKYDFKNGKNPFKFWSPNDKRKDFKVNHFGVVEKDGKKCLFVDVQFTNKTKHKYKHAYWKLPIKKIAVEGILRYKYRIKYGAKNDAKKAGIGIYFQIPEVKKANGRVFEHFSSVPKKQTGKIGQWLTYDENIIPLCSKLSAKWSKKYLGLKYGNGGCVITNLVILLVARGPQRVQFYLDFVELYGDTPTVASYLKVLPERVNKFKKHTRKIFAQKKQLITKIQQQAEKIYNTAGSKQVKNYAKALMKNIQDTLSFLKNKKILSKYDKEYFNYEIAAFKKALKELKAAKAYKSSISNATVYILDNPVSPFKILPHGVVPGKLTEELDIVAAQGEYEPVSIVINPEQDISKTFIEISDLKSVNGATIPSANLNIRSVKCWYQTDGAWFTYRPQSKKKVLVPELLLKDDSKVKVVEEGKTHLLKLDFPDGPQYVNPMDIKGPQFAEKPGKTPYYLFTPEVFPFKDSDDFKAVDLKAGTNKQFWISVKVPENAKPGIYNGTLDIKSPSLKIGSIKIKLRVLPFKLPAPATYSGKDYISSIYYRGSLNADYPQGSCSSDIRSLEQLKADYLSMLKHNIYNPTVYQDIRDHKKDPWEMLAKHLKLRQEVLGNKPLLACGTVWIGAPQTEKLINSRVRKAVKLKELASKFGVSQVYVQGVDEAGHLLVKKQRKIWKALHDKGLKVFVAGYEGVGASGGLLDILNYAGRPTPECVDAWHKTGNRILCYSAPQGGVENPYAYRESFGLKLWKLNVDGAMTYGYLHNGKTHYFDDGDRRREMAMAYLTTNGVIETIALVGYREAVDDIRYATLLKQLISSNRKGSKAKIAMDAETYLKNMDNFENLFEVRKKIIKFILQLQ